MASDKKEGSDIGSVGHLLKKRRHGLKLSLADVELATKIRGKFLVALEADDFTKLPNDVYSRGFVQNYAEFLGLDAASLIRAYTQARGGEPAAATSRPKPIRARSFVITPKLIIGVLSLLITGLIVTYLSWQFSLLAAPPQLDLTAPVGDQVVYGSVTDVSGHVAGGADVLVNDSPMLTDASGNFHDKLALQDGVNTIRVTAKNKMGKTTTVSRNILAHLPATSSQTAQTTLPPEVFDGVAIQVTIKGGATRLVVVVDGTETQLTMLDGTSQVWRGSNNIKLSTFDAGATSVTITNSKVAAKNLNTLGQNGEVKRELDFAKDTNFP